MNFTSPSGYTDVAKYKKVEMFTSIHTARKREQIISSFSQPLSPFGWLIFLTLDKSFTGNSTTEEYVQNLEYQEGMSAQAIMYQGGREKRN